MGIYKSKEKPHWMQEFPLSFSRFLKIKRDSGATTCWGSPPPSFNSLLLFHSSEKNLEVFFFFLFPLFGRRDFSFLERRKRAPFPVLWCVGRKTMIFVWKFNEAAPVMNSRKNRQEDKRRKWGALDFLSFPYFFPIRILYRVSPIILF